MGLENKRAEGRYTGMTKVSMILSGILNGTRTGILTHCILSACHELSQWKSWGVTRGGLFSSLWSRL